MNGRKWLKVFVLLSSLNVGFVGAINYVIDPYGYNNFIKINKINSKKYSNTSMTARFKSNILSSDDFNTIMLGTSRIGVMDPNILNNYLNVKAFNLEYPGSNAQIQNKFFKYAYHFNKDIKYLIYGIDFMAFNKNRTTKSNFVEFYDLETKIENNEEISNFEVYFNIDTFVSSIKLTIKNILGKQKTEAQYLSTNGMRDYINHIEELENGTFDLDRKIKLSIQSYFREKGVYKNYEFSYEFFNDFKDTLKFCKDNNIKVFVYIPPMYSDHFDAIAKAGYFDEFELFKKELVKITNFIDFTGHNSISTNKDNYWDSSHLRKELTKTVIASTTPNKYKIIMN